ncbi:hypothetical protein TUMEXPCC7403_22560 [Tumidithrix helvetica PCC 7403]|uniref:hypothetical protein n=1 Tax=Tumidithrix helvetica TaxID=3457545 RepID=UPI003CB8D8C2
MSLACSEVKNAILINNQRSLLLEDADYDGHSLSMLQKIAGTLNLLIEIKFSVIELETSLV